MKDKKIIEELIRLLDKREGHLKMGQHLWIHHLVPIINEFAGWDQAGREPLDGDDVDRLCVILKAKINLYEGNIGEVTYDSIMDHMGPDAMETGIGTIVLMKGKKAVDVGLFAFFILNYNSYRDLPLGTLVRVKYHPEDQFATILGVER